MTRFRPVAEILESRELLAGGLSVFPVHHGATDAIATGRDGNLYVASYDPGGGYDDGGGVGEITKVAPDGTILASYALPNSRDEPVAIVAATDGSIWVEEEQSKFSRIAPDGTITQINVPIEGGFDASSLAAGPDGSVDFINPGAATLDFTATGVISTYSTLPSIGRITADGVVSNLLTVTDGSPTSLAVEADGTVHFVDHRGDGSVAIDRIGTDGSLGENPLPASLANPSALALGPDGALWFLDDGNANALFEGGQQVQRIGRLDASGSFTSYEFTSQPFAQSGYSVLSHGLVSGPDGNLYFLDNNAVGRVTMAGVITETVVPIDYLQGGDTIGPDGNLWFAVQFLPGGGVARYSLGGSAGDSGGSGGSGSPGGSGDSTNPPPPPSSTTKGTTTTPPSTSSVPTSGALLSGPVGGRILVDQVVSIKVPVPTPPAPTPKVTTATPIPVVGQVPAQPTPLGVKSIAGPSTAARRSIVKPPAPSPAATPTAAGLFIPIEIQADSTAAGPSALATGTAPVVSPVFGHRPKTSTGPIVITETVQAGS